MNVKKVFYRKIKIAGQEKVVPYRKIELEKINDFHYISKEYKWNETAKEWMALGPCAFFDGEEFKVTGVVKTRTLGDVDNYFKLLIKYEKYAEMGDKEENV